MHSSKGFLAYSAWMLPFWFRINHTFSHVCLSLSINDNLIEQMNYIGTRARDMGGRESKALFQQRRVKCLLDCFVSGCRRGWGIPPTNAIHIDAYNHEFLVVNVLFRPFIKHLTYRSTDYRTDSFLYLSLVHIFSISVARSVLHGLYISY